MTGRAAAVFGAVLALVLAARAAADPETDSTQKKVKDVVAEGALDARPAPAGDRGAQGAAAKAAPAEPRPAADLPPQARPSVWRAGAHAPADVPAAVVVRTATRRATRARGGKGDRTIQGGEDEGGVEIIWHSPGSTP